MAILMVGEISSCGSGNGPDTETNIAETSATNW